MRINTIKESAANKYILQFINHVCNGDMAKANDNISNAIVEKLRQRTKKVFKENNDEN